MSSMVSLARRLSLRKNVPTRGHLEAYASRVTLSAKSPVPVFPDRQIARSCEADYLLALRRRMASRDHGPGPAQRRYAEVTICAQSERISCSTAHAPTFGGEGGR